MIYYKVKCENCGADLAYMHDNQWFSLDLNNRFAECDRCLTKTKITENNIMYITKEDYYDIRNKNYFHNEDNEKNKTRVNCRVLKKTEN